MKHIFLILPCLLLVGCTCNMPRALHISPPDCQKGLPNFKRYVEQDLFISGQNIRVVDLEMFYNTALQTCVGKYYAYKKDDKKDDMILFNIRNIRTNEDIYYEKYIGDSLKYENEGLQKYQEKVKALRGT